MDDNKNIGTTLNISNKRWLIYSAVTLNIANLLDALSTYIAINYLGKIEINEMFNVILEGYGNWAYLYKIIQVMGITILVYVLLTSIIDKLCDKYINNVWVNSRDYYFIIITIFLIGAYTYLLATLNNIGVI